VATIVLLCRLALAAVFGVAGVAKLADRAGSQQAMRGFGLGGRLAEVLGVLLPFGELAVAIALIPVGSAWWGAVGALCLLASFGVAIALNLARGRTPECHCFGQLHSVPVGWRTLVRVAALALVAGLVVAQGPGAPYDSATAWLGRLNTSALAAISASVLAVCVAILAGWFGLELLRQHGRLLGRIDALEAALASAGIAAPRTPQAAGMIVHGLPVGTSAPDFALPSVDGEVVALSELLERGLPVMLLFTDPQCGPCESLLPDVVTWQRNYVDRFNTVLIASGSLEDNRNKREQHGLDHVLVQAEHEVAEAYKVNGTPASVLVSTDQLIASAIHTGPDTVRLLVERELGVPGRLRVEVVDGNGTGSPESSIASGLPVGSPAPDFQLADLSGEDVSLGESAASRPCCCSGTRAAASVSECSRR
jgi:methylamine dehydrogenase accessory protein MauD